MPPSDVLDASPQAPERESQLAEHRLERLRRLERENEMLRGERDRSERLLALAVDSLSRKTGVSVQLLMDLFAAILGTDLARPAWVEARERRRREAASERISGEYLKELLRGP